jgi:hypothetical protein
MNELILYRIDDGPSHVQLRTMAAVKDSLIAQTGCGPQQDPQPRKAAQ